MKNMLRVFCLLPFAFCIVACTSTKCLEEVLRFHRENDYCYNYEFTKLSSSGDTAKERISVVKSGNRTAWVSPNVIGVESQTWSYAAFRDQGIAYASFLQGPSSRAYAPSDFVSVLEFVADSAENIDCSQGSLGSAFDILVTLRKNSLGFTDMSLDLDEDGFPRFININILDSISQATYTMTYDIVRTTSTSSEASQYLQLIAEGDGRLVATGTLSRYKSITSILTTE